MNFKTSKFPTVEAEREKLKLPFRGMLWDWGYAFHFGIFRHKKILGVGAVVLRRFCKNRNSRLTFCAAQLRHTVHTHPLLSNVSLRFIIGETTRAPFCTTLSSSDDSPKSAYSVRISLGPSVYSSVRFLLTLVSIDSRGYCPSISYLRNFVRLLNTYLENTSRNYRNLRSCCKSLRKRELE